ncbi:MAG: CapA family protein [Lachnospiraceae bacterium]|nr:CapA family protein [Lachnospiraceae bacterium]
MSMKNGEKKRSIMKKVLIADAILGLLLIVVLLFGGASLKAKHAAEERAAAAQAEAERIAAAQAREEEEAAKRKEQEDAEAAAIEAEKAEAERIAAAQAEAQAEAERIAAEQAAAETTVHLTMVGDVLLSSMIDAACQLPDGGYDFNVMFENVIPYLADYDLKIVNEETACGGAEFGISGYPSFNSPHEAQDAIANAGFNCICTASNHMLDLGTGPLFSSLNYWKTAYPDMPVIGSYDSQEASDQIYYYEKDGFRIAILNYTYGSNAGSGEYYDAPWSVNMLYEDEVRNDIRIAKENSDYVIVCPHWGTEYTLSNDDYQAMWAQIFLQEGVDLVLGTHPHVPEPIEVFNREDGHQMICYYSLGNFISNQDAAYSLVGGMADVTIRKTAEGVVVDDFGIVPIVTHKSSYYTTYLLKDYNNDMAWGSLGVATDPDFSWDYCVNLVTSMYGDRLRNF